MAEEVSPFLSVDGGVRIRLRLTPKAVANRLGPIECDAEGRGILKAGVTTVPEGGKANQALIKLLSKVWKIPKGTISVIQGETDRNKILLIEGLPETILGRLDRWRKENG